MTAHELAALLLEKADLPVTIRQMTGINEVSGVDRRQEYQGPGEESQWVLVLTVDLGTVYGLPEREEYHGN